MLFQESTLWLDIRDYFTFHFNWNLALLPSSYSSFGQRQMSPHITGHKYAINNFFLPFAHLTTVVVWILGILPYSLGALPPGLLSSSTFKRIVWYSGCFLSSSHGGERCILCLTILAWTSSASPEIINSSNHSVPTTHHAYSSSTYSLCPGLGLHYDLNISCLYYSLGP